MKKELQELLDADKKRGYGSGFLKSLQYRYVIVWRKASYYSKKHPLGVYYRLKLKSLSEKSGIQIPTETKIGKGLLIAHFGTIIINPSAELGDNINIAPNVVIGKANRGDKKGVPTIGNNVWIGAGSVIVGKITIGDDVLIAPNAYVNMDIPPHSIAIGNPVVIHPRNNATESYINNIV